jgi:hypothetical protein
MGGISVNRGRERKGVRERGERGWKGMWAHIEVRVIYWVHYVGKIRFHCNSLEWISSLDMRKRPQILRWIQWDRSLHYIVMKEIASPIF